MTTTDPAAAETPAARQVRELVDAAPPLARGQLDTLAAVLRPREQSTPRPATIRRRTA